MCVNVSYSSLPESLRSRLAAVFGMKPGEVARFEEHPLQVEYLDNGTALVHVTKVVLTDAAALQHLLSIDGPASPSGDIHASSHQAKGAS